MITINGLEPSFSKFPNNEYNVTLSDSILNGSLLSTFEAHIDWNFEETDELFKLGMLLSTLEVTDVVDVYINVNYVPYSRMDRHDEKKPNPVSMQIFVDMLPEFRNGFTYYTFQSVHNPIEMEKMLESRFGTNGFPVGYEIAKPRELVKMEEIINRGQDLHHTLFIFPDKGSIARYKEYVAFKQTGMIGRADDVDLLIDNSFAQLPNHKRFRYAYGEKKRDFVTHKITGYELMQANGETFDFFEDDSDYYSAVIIDDVVSFGGTFIKILDELATSSDIKDVTLIAGNVEDSMFRGDLLQHKLLKKVITFEGLTKHTTGDKLRVYKA